MDTSQPFALQFMSQNMSMLIGIASGISIFTLLALIWRSKYQWNLTAKFLLASIFGWIIGGFMGVEQGNLSLDIYEHNTYLVVSHFHLNALDGIILAAFGVTYWILPEIAHKQWYSRTLSEIHLWGSIIGGFGLAGTFALLGFIGTPRREYSPVISSLPFTSGYQPFLILAFFFAIVVASAQIPFIWNLIKSLMGPTIKPTALLPAVAPQPVLPSPAPAPLVRSLEDNSIRPELPVDPTPVSGLTSRAELGSFEAKSE
jgi:cytochrome c oxidase subunit 1